MSDNSDDHVLTPRQRDWLEHLQRCERSGLSLKAYADANGLSVSALYTARRNFKARGVWPREPQASARAPRFVSVKVERPPIAVGAMTVRLPDGVVVEVLPGCPAEAGAALVRALMAPAS